MMKNIDINEWLLNNNIDPMTEIVVDGKQSFLFDVLEKHLKEQFAIHSVVGRSEQLPCHECSGNGGGVTDNGWERCDCQK